MTAGTFGGFIVTPLEIGPVGVGGGLFLGSNLYVYGEVYIGTPGKISYNYGYTNNLEGLLTGGSFGRTFEPSGLYSYGGGVSDSSAGFFGGTPGWGVTYGVDITGAIQQLGSSVAAAFQSNPYSNQALFPNGYSYTVPSTPSQVNLNNTLPEINKIQAGALINMRDPTVGSQCFPATTEIGLPASPGAPIERMCCGDTVLAFDRSANHGRGALMPARVTHIFRNITQEWLVLSCGLTVTPATISSTSMAPSSA
jgi:hypothetical protein